MKVMPFIQGHHLMPQPNPETAIEMSLVTAADCGNKLRLANWARLPRSQYHAVHAELEDSGRMLPLV